MKEQYRAISPEIWSQICTAKTDLVGSPDFDLLRNHRALHFLKVEAAKHSVGIEMPHGHKARKGRGRNIAEENLKAAQSFFEDGYKGSLNHGLIMHCAELIEPHLRPVSYRSENDPTTYSSGRDPHIYPTDVSPQMDDFFAFNDKLYTPVGKAVHAHFHIARIHPFRDGNGRLARLVQNGILARENFPPIVLNEGERTKYMKLISAASRSANEKHPNMVTNEQATFYNFLATKLLSSLSNLRQKAVLR